VHEHDRHGVSHLQQWLEDRNAPSQDDVGRECGQLRRVSANFGDIGRGPVGVDAHVAADDPVQKRQPLMERCEAGLKHCVVGGCGQEHTDAPYLFGLLRACGKRPSGCRGSNSFNEITPAHLTSL
jgi:hypothetical protein